MKTGNVLRSLDIVTVPQAAGIDLYPGCVDKNIISISNALHATFSCTGTKYLGLNGSLFLA